MQWSQRRWPHTRPKNDRRLQAGALMSSRRCPQHCARQRGVSHGTVCGAYAGQHLQGLVVLPGDGVLEVARHQRHGLAPRPHLLGVDFEGVQGLGGPAGKHLGGMSAERTVEGRGSRRSRRSRKIEERKERERKERQERERQDGEERQREESDEAERERPSGEAHAKRERKVERKRLSGEAHKREAEEG